MNIMKMIVHRKYIYTAMGIDVENEVNKEEDEED